MADLFETLGLGQRRPDDNVVFFTIYPDKQPAGPEELAALKTRCEQVLQPLLGQGYVWQCEPFSLTPSTQVLPPWEQPSKRRRPRTQSSAPQAQKTAQEDLQGSQQPQATPQIVSTGCLWGRLHWGDNVEDEWWVVHLLRHLTSQLLDISAQVWDNDGEFLLIEAAYVLPRWLKPDTASNRVWIRGGTVHAIPPPSPKYPQLPAFPTLSQALQVLVSGTVKTQSQRIDDAIAVRLSGQPAVGLAAGRHVSRMLLPVRVAAVLQQDPQLVAAAVDAFFFRDADDMKAAARMAHFPPSEPRVSVLVATNRCQYAQLAQQRFEPPRGWKLPPPGHPEAASAERGLKVTAGFEILAAHAQRMGLCGGDNADREPPAPNSQSPPAQAPILNDMSGHPSWAAFKSSLQRLGYFQDELEGSVKYRELLAQAARDFQQSVVAAHEVSVDSSSQATAPQRLVTLLRSPVVTAVKEEDFQASGQGSEDDDSWLESMAERLESELNAREAEVGVGGIGGASERRVDVDAADVAGAMRGFMEYARAGLEGAEVPKSGLGSDVGFDPGLFFSQLERVLGDMAELGHTGGRQRASGRAQGHGVGVQRQGVYDSDDDMDGDGQWEDSDGEGSSFFSDNEDEDPDAEEDSWGQEGEHDEEVAEERAWEAFHHLDTTPNFKSQRTPASGEGAAGAAGDPQDKWEVFTATDSDDDDVSTSDTEASEWDPDVSSRAGDSEQENRKGVAQATVGRHSGGQAQTRSKAAFAAAYDEVLREQLAGTTLEATVERMPAADGAQAAQASGQGGTQTPLQPMDLDFNLVRNLLKSVAEQQGLAGPASNLAGLLGVKLPHGADPSALA